jgi:hypothetical protein
VTNEQMNVAIGLALGLEIERKTRRGNPCPNGVEYWYLLEHHGGVQTWRKLPNYCTDLNEMHEAEKVLQDDQREVFYPRNLGAWQRPFNVIYATARQRAEAFLRTVGKWEATTEDSSVVEKEVQQ